VLAVFTWTPVCGGAGELELARATPRDRGFDVVGAMNATAGCPFARSGSGSGSGSHRHGGTDVEAEGSGADGRGGGSSDDGGSPSGDTSDVGSTPPATRMRRGGADAVVERRDDHDTLARLRSGHSDDRRGSAVRLASQHSRMSRLQSRASAPGSASGAASQHEHNGQDSRPGSRAGSGSGDVPGADSDAMIAKRHHEVQQRRRGCVCVLSLSLQGSMTGRRAMYVVAVPPLLQMKDDHGAGSPRRPGSIASSGASHSSTSIQKVRRASCCILMAAVLTLV
jgi:hypothetical protein